MNGESKQAEHLLHKQKVKVFCSCRMQEDKKQKMAQRSGSTETAKMSFNYCIARKFSRELIWQFDQQRHHQIIIIANIFW